MLPSNTLLPLASLDLGKKNDEKALACLYLFLLFTEYHNKAMRFNYQNIFLFFFPNSYSTSKIYNEHYRRGTGQVPRVCYSISLCSFLLFFFFFGIKLHITPRLFTEGHVLLSAMDYALLSSTAYAKSKAEMLWIAQGQGGVCGGEGDAIEAGCSYAAHCSIIVIRRNGFQGLKCQV